MLFFYNAQTRVAGTGSTEADGSFVPKKDFPVSAGFGEWTHIISDGTILFFYNSETRHAGTGKLDSDGNFIALKDFPPEFGFGEWTHIVSDDREFKGSVVVDDLTVRHDIVLAGADCAEEFEADSDTIQALPAGSVVVLGDEGRLRQSVRAYDKRVAGVVSGGGEYRPGIVLDRRRGEENRVAVALMGKVGCLVDASCAPLAVGDLLTSSDTPGHAMKAIDPSRAFGAVIGKALQPLRTGTAMVSILVGLQ